MEKPDVARIRSSQIAQAIFRRETMRISLLVALSVALLCHTCGALTGQRGDAKQQQLSGSRFISRHRIKRLAKTSLAVSGEDARTRLVSLLQKHPVAAVEAAVATTGVAQALLQPKSNSGAWLLAAAGGVGLLGDMLELSGNTSRLHEEVRAIAQGRHAQIAVFALLVALKHSPPELLRPLLVRLAPLCVFGVLACVIAALPDEIRSSIKAVDRSGWTMTTEDSELAESSGSVIGWMAPEIVRLADIASLILEFLAYPSLLKSGFSISDLLLLTVFWAYAQLRVMQLVRDSNILSLFSRISSLLWDNNTE